MKTIFYTGKPDPASNELWDHLTLALPGIEIEHATSLQMLSKKLRQPMNRISAIVAQLFSINELTGLIRLLPLLENKSLILILPDRDKNTLSLGASLAPSFITYKDNSINDVASVLQKIYENKKKQFISNIINT